MQYLCLAYGDEAKSNALSQKEMDEVVARCQVYDAELRATGKVVSGMSLGWAATTLLVLVVSAAGFHGDPDRRSLAELSLLLAALLLVVRVIVMRSARSSPSLERCG